MLPLFLLCLCLMAANLSSALPGDRRLGLVSTILDDLKAEVKKLTGAGRARRPKSSSASSTSEASYVAIKIFTGTSCSTYANVVFVLQNICMPNIDQGNFKGYIIYSADASGVKVKEFAPTDASCAGTPAKAYPLAPGQCYPDGAVSYTFTPGSAPKFDGMKGLYYFSFSSMASCENNDLNSVIAVMPLSSTIPLPDQFFGETVKVSCASPLVVQVQQFSGNATTYRKNLGPCSTEAPGGYALALRCLSSSP